jgi:hypothetical protein
MSVLEFRGGRSTQTVLSRLADDVPELVAAARWFLERADEAGVRLSLTDSGVERLDKYLRGLAQQKLSSEEGTAMARSAGAFFACLLQERVGGRLTPHEGSWLLTEVGPRQFSYDPFEPAHLLLTGRSELQLAAELEMLRHDVRGAGPRTRFETLFEECYRRLTGRKPGEHMRGFCYRTGTDEWVFLDNLYRRAGPSPDRWPQEMENFVRKLVGAAIEKRRLDSDLTSRIFPTLKPVTEADKRLSRLPVSDDLVLVFALDMLRSMSFVTRVQARAWGLSPHELRRVAFDNLAQRNFGMQLDPVRNTISVNENDGYDAARVLLPGFARRARKLLGAAVHVALPHRDLLMVLDAERADAAGIEAEVETLYRSKAYPLSPRVFRLVDDTLPLAAKP